MGMKTKQCKFCKELMRADASTCPSCGKSEMGLGTFLVALFFVSPFLFCIGFILFAAIS